MKMSHEMPLSLTRVSQSFKPRKDTQWKQSIEFVKLIEFEIESVVTLQDLALPTFMISFFLIFNN